MQEHIRKSPTRASGEQALPDTKRSERTDDLLSDADDLLDEIDALLAECDIVAADFVQKGGE